MGRLGTLDADDVTGRKILRDEVIRLCLPFAERLARRFHGLGEPAADLNQVAALGLVQAVDRYDPTRSAGSRVVFAPGGSGGKDRGVVAWYGVDSPDDRDRAGQARDDAADARDGAAQGRDRDAHARDRSATTRDETGHVWQRAEWDRLRAGDRRDRAAAWRGEAARLREQVAAEHQPDREQLLILWEQAASDRDAAAADREQAARRSRRRP